MTDEPDSTDLGTTALPDASPATVVRSEEHLRVGVRTQVRERVMVRKRTVTEEVTRTVTVAREVLDIEHLPVDAADQATLRSADAPDPVELDIVLHEERIVVTTEVVPVERVRVRVHKITEQVDVADVLRREHVEILPATPADTA